MYFNLLSVKSLEFIFKTFIYFLTFNIISSSTINLHYVLFKISIKCDNLLYEFLKLSLLYSTLLYL
jgi:hypothetical protein